MAERTLRGSRLGAVSYETDRNAELAPRKPAEYRCPKGHVFGVPFADDAEIPLVWECKFDGSIARLIDGEEPEASSVQHGRGPPFRPIPDGSAVEEKLPAGEAIALIGRPAD